MTGHKIIIEKLKGIKQMTFEFPEKGVHVISATNGSGKTTLLVCIEKIVKTSAFSENFKQHVAINLDSYEDSRITYHNQNGDNVTYAYRRKSNSWRPMKKSRNVLEKVYTKIQYMPTLGKRVYVQGEILKKGTVKDVNQELRNAMTEVLEDRRFANLLRLPIGETRGRKGSSRRENTAYLLPLGTKQYGSVRRNTYHSENTFSLGEIFVLNLLHLIQHIDSGSLLLVDELEVALHPRVQFKLLRYLEKIALEKGLTILVSTHSSSIIKCAKNLIFIEKEADGTSKVHYNCFPAYALRDVAILEDISPDYVFYVEDRMAEALVKSMLEIYFKEVPGKVRPYCKVLPIGGYPEVLNFGKRSLDYLIPNFIGQYLFLDHDVVAIKKSLQLQGNNRSISEQKLWELFNELDSRTRYLEITPEVGLLNWLTNQTEAFQSYLDSRFTDRIIDLIRIMTDCHSAFPNLATNVRKAAKNKINWIGTELGRQLSLDPDKAIFELFGLYSDHLYSNPIQMGKLKSIFGPIFNQRGNR